MPRNSLQAPPIIRIAVAQSLVTVLLGGITYLLLGRVSAYSLMLGGLISTVPNACFARMVFRYRGARAMPQAVKAIYLGELTKLVLMGTGFALAFTLVEPLDAISLFAGFVLVHLAGMAALVKIHKPLKQDC